MLTDRKSLALPLLMIPPLGAALLLSTAPKPAHAGPCANAVCASPSSCMYWPGYQCIVAGGACHYTNCVC
jgi:hypothetical protein